MIPPIREDTPSYWYPLSDGARVLVKREDLQGDGDLLPPWGKLLGLKKLLETLPSEPELYWLSLRGSYVVHALDAFYSLRSGPIRVFYATKEPPFVPKHITLQWMRANVLPILLRQIEKQAEETGALVLPFGLANEAHYSVSAKRALTVDTENATVIVTCGTGATLHGLLRGFAASAKVYAVCISSKDRISKTVQPDERVTYVELPMGRRPALIKTPFPCHPYWDAHGWKWLTEHHTELPNQDKIIFWNLGG